MQRLGFSLPAEPSVELLTGAIFAEASTRGTGGEDGDEREAIGWALVNMTHYATFIPEGKRRCYNADFGDGSLLGAIRRTLVAYGGPRWSLVMQANRLKPAEALVRLQPGDREHLRRCVEAANRIGPNPDRPHLIRALGNRAPVQFNQAHDRPPSPRQTKIGRLGSHSFYGFIEGRECD